MEERSLESMTIEEAWDCLYKNFLTEEDRSFFDRFNSHEKIQENLRQFYFSKYYRERIRASIEKHKKSIEEGLFEQRMLLSSLF